MSQPFIGEIRLFGGNFAPQGWAFCDGSTLAISQNETLFNLIGTSYGGDGQTTFLLPDLRGRVPMHQGAGSVLGEKAGSETVALTPAQLPAHTHAMFGSSSPADRNDPDNALFAGTEQAAYGTSRGSTASLGTAAVGYDGGGNGHNNVQPFLCVSFIISLFGIFPSRN